MKIRKKLSMCISLIAAAAMMFSFNASATDLNESADTEPQWIEDTVDIYSVIVDSFAETPNYAGAYFKNNVLHISTTDVDASENFLNQIAASSTETIPEVKFNEVKYTYSELSEIKRYFIDQGRSSGIVGAYTDPEDNKVVIEVVEIPAQFTNENQTIPNADAVMFDQVDGGNIVNDAEYIRGGYALSDTTQGAGRSFGCMFKWNSTGEYGFLTAAHDTVEVDDVFKYSGVEIGTVASVQNSGSIDAALIKRTNSSYTGSNKNGTGGVVCTMSGSPVVGETITMFGKTTGSSTGTVLKTDYENTNGMTNLILTTCTSQSGDSGGALIATRPNGNKVFVGINKGHVGSNEVGINWTTIKNTYEITRVYSTEN